jgi:hypothetical protein
MPDQPHVRITHGQVQINDGYECHLISHADVHVWQFDLRTKYANVLYTSCGDGFVEVTLTADENTLRADGPSDVLTAIRIENLGRGDWTVLATVARYTATVVVYALDLDSPEARGGTERTV